MVTQRSFNLNSQIQLTEEEQGKRPLILGRIDPDPSWSLEQEGFDPGRECDSEALFTLGNGYVGARGSLSIPIPSSQTDLFIAGIYGPKSRLTPYSELEFLDNGGRDDPYVEIIPVPSPFEFALSMNGAEFTLENSEHHAFRRVLDFKNACVHEDMLWKLTESHRLSVSTARMVFLGEPHLLMQEISLKSEIQALQLDCAPMLLGSDLATKHVHLKLIMMQTPSPGVMGVLLETSRSTFRIAIGEKTWCNGHEISNSTVSLNLVPGGAALIQRAIVIYTSRECADPLAEVISQLKKMNLSRISKNLKIHQEQWARYWQVADIRVLQHPELTEAQRFNLFHLRAVASDDATTGIGARALSGRAYEGHVFWDSEIFVFPFLLHVDPRLAKSNLDYRYHTLDGARRTAKTMGCLGACYAWESTITGDDVTPKQLFMKSAKQVVPIFTGTQQIHVTADVAFAISKYWNETRDTQWMLRKGVEILIETARFWASRVTKDRDQFHILRVVGPDEYHHDVNDNAYTNWMARLNLQVAESWCQRMRELDPQAWKKLGERLKFSETEIALWRGIAGQLYIPQPNDKGVIEQFTGFFKLNPIPLRHAEGLKAPLDRLLEWKRVNEEQLIKQADVLMIPFLFPKAFSKKTLEANYRYYEPRTDHGSSLSPCVYASVAAQIGDWAEANRFWRMGLELDLMDLMRNTALGIHPGNMAGTWQALMFHILGLKNLTDKTESEGFVGKKARERFIEQYGPIEFQAEGQLFRLGLENKEGKDTWVSMAG